jgi:PhnB protein
MMTKAKPIPDGFHAVTPYLIVKNASQAIEFYKKAFGAQERYRLPMPDGKIGHAELQIRDSIVMVSDENPQFGNQSPQALNGSPVGFALYVDNVDQAFERAVKAGATVKEPIGDKFWGDRVGSVMDPFGHKWSLLTHIEDVSPEEMKRRMEKMPPCPSGQNKST